MKKYNVIQVAECTLHDGYNGRCVLLREEGNNEFIVLLDGDFWFLEGKIVNILETTPVNNLGDLVEYCNKHNLDIPPFNGEYILVGGERDFAIEYDLTGDWLEYKW